jgi:hypothetical protein
MVRLAVVSNGRGVVGGGHGEAIDRHDQVMRFNRFETKGFEKDCGTKTTIWFFSNEVDSMSHNGSQLGNWCFTPANQFANRPRCSDPAVVHIDNVYECELAEKIGLTERKHPTTGMIGLWWAIRSLQFSLPISTVGWFVDGGKWELFLPHYYGPDINETVIPWHDTEAEARLFEKWIDEGLVNRLDGGRV